MELGEKLRQARLEAGLSQRQLCGEEITRNMLSLIEHGAAKPSMQTLKYLAGRLGKPVSFFLEEEAEVSPNQALMARARASYDLDRPEEVLELLEDYREPDALCDRERQLLQTLARLRLGEKALSEDRRPYARQLLEPETPQGVYCREALERQRRMLLASMGEVDQRAQVAELPSIDPELLLRARAALAAGRPQRALGLLSALEEDPEPSTELLMGRALAEAGNWGKALHYLHRAEKTLPAEAAFWLERCYRELEDYKQAYFYACKRREK